MSQTIVEITKKWLREVVIGFNLCPFAAHPFEQGSIRYTCYEGQNLAELFKLVEEELSLFAITENTILETSILILPNVLVDFLTYLDFTDQVNEMLIKMGLEGEVQLATFHPKYQFAGTQKEQVENFTNRSPYPLLHFLREASVEKAIEFHENVDMIPIKNIDTMKKIGVDKMLAIMNQIKH